MSNDETLKEAFLTSLNKRGARFVEGEWTAFAHAHQLPPKAAQGGGDWTTWLLLGGRGAGKTLAGAQWVRAMAQGRSPFADREHSPIALVGEGAHEVRHVMIEGVSGLLAAHPRAERPTWQPALRRIEWSNGAIAQVFSAEDPEGLRGPQFAAAWLDELAKWRNAEATFDMLQFGLRLGRHPRQMITTTPRPIALIKRLLADPAVAVTRAATEVNAAHLAPAFLQAVVARYAGTRLGRQELDGEIIDDRPDALWSHALIETCRVAAAPPLMRIVVAVDPPVSARQGADACGIVAAGRGPGDIAYVIADETVAGLSPAGWASKAIALWRRLSADALVVELSMLECPAFTLTLLHALWTGHDAGINGFAAVSGLLIAYFGARFGVLGVYVSGRTREKQSVLTGEVVPSIVSQVLKAMRAKR